jgi:hypothetical protein
MNLINGTNIGDGLRVGTVTGNGPVGIGGKTSPFFNFIVKPGAAAATAISPNPVTINPGTTIIPLVAGAYATFENDPVYGRLLKLDYARTLRMNIGTGGGGDITIRVDGLDILKQPVTEEQTLTTAATNNVLHLRKAIKWIKQIKAIQTGGAANQVIINPENRFGLPYAVTNPNSVDIRPINNFNPSIWCEGVATFNGATPSVATINSPFAPAYAGGALTPGTGLIPTVSVLPREGVIPGSETITVSASVQSNSITFQSSIPGSTSSFYWRMNYEPDNAIPVAGGQAAAFPSGYANLTGGSAVVYSPYVNSRNQYIMTSYPAGGTVPAVAPYVSASTSVSPGVSGQFTINGTNGSGVLWEIANADERGPGAGGPIYPYVITADRTMQFKASASGIPGNYYSTQNAGDVRGVVGMTQEIGTGFNGTSIIIYISMYLEGVDSTYVENQTNAGLYGVNQYVANDWGA